MDGVRFIALKVKIHKFWLGELYFRGPRLEGGRAVQGSGMGGALCARAPPTPAAWAAALTIPGPGATLRKQPARENRLAQRGANGL